MKLIFRFDMGHSVLRTWCGAVRTALNCRTAPAFAGALLQP